MSKAQKIRTRKVIGRTGGGVSPGPLTVSVRPSRGSSKTPEDLLKWLLGPGRRIRSLTEFLDQFCWLLVSNGLPLWRASVHLQVLHPQLQRSSYRWWRDPARIEEVVGKHGIEQTAVFRDSPLKPVVNSGVVVRHRLADPSLILRMPFLHELRQQGVMDYLALPLTFSSGQHHAMTFSSDREVGFSEQEIAHLIQLSPVLALITEVHATRFMMATLLSTYIGQKAGARVLGGRVRLGSGEQIEAVVFVTDLRRFTDLSDRLPSKQVLQVLNQFFDLVVRPIHAEGGEVLKFLGDGLLAIFSVDTCGGAASATECALKVANAIIAKLGELNAIRSGNRLDPLELGIGLHIGPVFFGNVGAEDRLDFTAVGPTVNLAFRLEALTKKVRRTIVVSDKFAAACPIPTQPLGQHILHHPEKSVPVFTPLSF